MKNYKVVFLPEARLEAIAAAEYIAESAPRTAARWYEGLERAIRSLDAFPRRCPLAPESEFLGEELRHYVFKSHRIIFRVEEDTRTVWVLHVRHARQRTLGEPDLESPPPADDPS